MEGGRISANEMVSMVLLFMIDYTAPGSLSPPEAQRTSQATVAGTGQVTG
jgi:hypothetical protein